MFGIGRFLKKTYVGRKFQEAKKGIEGLFDDAGFKSVFDFVKVELEKKIDEIELTFTVVGELKWKALASWLGERYPVTVPFMSMFHKWVSGWVAAKKAAGLFK